MTEVQVAPRALDATKTPEVPEQRQMHETQKAASNILQRKVADVNAELAERTPQEQQQILNTDKGKNAIRSLWLFGNDTRSRNFRDEQNPDGIDVKKGNQLIVETDRGRGKVHFLESADADSITCVIEIIDRPEQVTRAIPRAEMVRAHTIAEASTILEQFPSGSPQRLLVEMYIQSLRGETLQSSNGQPVNEVIKKAAENAGLLTTDDLETLVNKHFPETDQQGNPITLSEEQIGQRQKILDLLEGRNLVDLETMKAVFEGLGYQGDFFAPNGRLARYFQDIEQGNIDPESAKQFIEAVRSGDASAVEQAVPESEQAKNERERQEARAKMSEYAPDLLKKPKEDALKTLRVFISQQTELPSSSEEVANMALKRYLELQRDDILVKNNGEVPGQIASHSLYLQKYREAYKAAVEEAARNGQLPESVNKIEVVKQALLDYLGVQNEEVSNLLTPDGQVKDKKSALEKTSQRRVQLRKDEGATSISEKDEKQAALGEYADLVSEAWLDRPEGIPLFVLNDRRHGEIYQDVLKQRSEIAAREGIDINDPIWRRSVAKEALMKYILEKEQETLLSLIAALLKSFSISGGLIFITEAKKEMEAIAGGK